MIQTVNQSACPEPGIHPEVSWADYVDLDALNPSAIKNASTSMAHVKHYLEHGSPDTRPKFIGRATHCALFEPERFKAEYRVWDGDRRGNDYKAFKAECEAAGAEDIKTSELDECVGIAKGALAHPRVNDALAEGQAEVTVIAQDQGVTCKGRMDFLRDDAILDLKTTSNIKCPLFGKGLANLGTHISLGLYRRWVKMATGVEIPVYIIAVEQKPPHTCRFVRVPDEVLSLGETVGVAHIQGIKRCMDTGVWPGPEDGELYFPDYMMPSIEIDMEDE